MKNLTRKLICFMNEGRKFSVPSQNKNIIVRWKKSEHFENFGDKLSDVIFQLMLYRRGFFIDDIVNNPTRVLGVGSILHFAKDGDVVWGSGINGKVDVSYSGINLDIRSVRGPLTQGLLKKAGHVVPSVFGDPAVLLDHLLLDNLQEISVEHKVSVLPNLNDDMDKFRRYPELNFISPLSPWREVRRKIRQSETVITSSLHGIILSEQSLTDVILLLPDKETTFKYEDYFEGTGRRMPAFHKNVADCLGASPIDRDHFDVQPLQNAFPYDLWEEE